MHIRQQIAEALQTLLLGLPLTGGQVSLAPVWALKPESLPHIGITTPKDEMIHQTIGAGSFVRELTIQITVRHMAGALYLKHLNSITESIENAIQADRTLGGLCKPVAGPDTQIRFSEEGQTLLAVADLLYTVTYSHPANDVSIIN